MGEKKEETLLSSEKAVSPLVATVMIIASAVALLAVVMGLALALKSSPAVGMVMLATFTLAIGAVIVTVALAVEAPK